MIVSDKVYCNKVYLKLIVGSSAGPKMKNKMSAASV